MCAEFVNGDQVSAIFDFSAAFDVLHSLILEYFLYSMMSIQKLSPAQSPPLNSKLSHLSTWISDSQTTKSPNPTFLSEPEVTLSPFWPNPSAESPAPLPPLHCTSRQVDPWQDPGSAHLATPPATSLRQLACTGPGAAQRGLPPLTGAPQHSGWGPSSGQTLH